MKKLRSEKAPIHLTLEIIAVLNDVIVSMPIAAARHDITLEYRDLLKSEWQLTKAELSTYRSFLVSMASIIESYGFEIVDEYQSDESYSYYIQFTPILDPGVLDNAEHLIPMKPGTDLLLDVKFRLSNHFEDDEPIAQDSTARSIASGKMFKEFVLNGIVHTSINSAIVDLQEICKELRQGNYDRLYDHSPLY